MSTTEAESSGSTLAPLAQLRVADGVPSTPGSSRDLFPPGSTLMATAVTPARTRWAESLITATVSDSGCDVLDGRWLSIYDEVEITESSDLVDHLVPLAEAWRSGASGWETTRRMAFANDSRSPTTS
jgi:hypothetical protein